MGNLSLQRRVFDEVLSKFERRADAVDHLAGMLSLGRNAIYRRLRGDSLLTLGELQLLAQHFNLSLDSIFLNSDSDKVIFSYPFLSKRTQNFLDFLSEIQENTRIFDGRSQAEAIYTCQEIPFFLYFSSPPIFAFKMYVFGLAYWNFPSLQQQKYHFDLVGEELCKQAQAIAAVYQSIPSTELWNANMIDTLLAQIHYFFQIEQFSNPTDALLLCDELLKLVRHARQMAETGRKFSPDSSSNGKNPEFHLFVNDFFRTNDTLLISTDREKVLVTSFGTPNYLKTNNHTVCDQFETWLKSVVIRSTPISLQQALERERYFNELERRIRRTKDGIERSISSLEMDH